MTAAHPQNSDQKQCSRSSEQAQPPPIPLEKAAAPAANRDGGVQKEAGASEDDNTITSQTCLTVEAGSAGANDSDDDDLGNWVFLRSPGQFRNVRTGEEMSKQSFDLTFQAVVPEVDYTPAGRRLGKPKIVPPSEYLLHYAYGLSVSNTIYLPQHAGADPVIKIDGVEFLNSYLPAFVPVAAASYAGHWAHEVWDGHLKRLLPKEWCLLLQWLAFNVQNPGRKILWAPIIKGTPGDGKTSISTLLGAVMGQRNVKVVGSESLFSDFTAYAEGSCVAFLEEIRMTGHSRINAMDKLKPLITNDVIDVVKKGSNGKNLPNVTNYMAFTNHEDALVIDENDRRWGVFFTPFADRASLRPAGMDADYFDRLHSAISNHADVLRAWLLDVDTADFNPKIAPPMTAAKSTMIARSMSPDAAMVKEMVELGREGVGRHVAATNCINAALKQEFGATIQTTRMAAAFAEIGWQVVAFEIKWMGQARKVYVSKDIDWPSSEPHLRAMVREHLDKTLNRDQLELSAGRKLGAEAW